MIQGYVFRNYVVLFLLPPLTLFQPPEQVLTGLFTEVKRQKPSVIFIPNIDTWYGAMSAPALTAFLGMLRSLHPTDPIMVLATAEAELKDLSSELRRDLFGFSKSNIIEIVRPLEVRPFSYLKISAETNGR